MSKDIAVANLNPPQSEFETLQRQCSMAVQSGLLPSEYSKGNSKQQIAKAMVVAMKGRELGIPMMQAFSGIHVIKGKPAMAAELMLALIYKRFPNSPIHFKKYTSTECVISASRDGVNFTEFSFTMQDARNAGITGNDTWKKYPRAMLRSRAITEMARTLFPDGIMGVSYAPEELGRPDLESEDIEVSAREVVENPVITAPIAAEPKSDSLLQEREAIFATSDIPSCFEMEESLDDINSQLNESEPPELNVAAEIPNFAPQTAQEAKDLQDNTKGSYIFQKGKFKGQKIAEVAIELLEPWVNWMENQGYDKGADYKAAVKYLE